MRPTCTILVPELTGTQILAVVDIFQANWTAASWMETYFVIFVIVLFYGWPLATTEGSVRCVKLQNGSMLVTGASIDIEIGEIAILNELSL